VLLFQSFKELRSEDHSDDVMVMNHQALRHILFLIEELVFVSFVSGLQR
jgi:hypothetical protein